MPNPIYLGLKRRGANPLTVTNFITTGSDNQHHQSVSQFIFGVVRECCYDE